MGAQSGPRARAQTQAQLQLADINSSDDDEEGIPHSALPKRRFDPDVRSLDYRRSRSRRPDGDQSIQPGEAKRRKVESKVESWRASQRPAPALSSTVLSVENATSRSGRGDGLNPENGVPVGLVDSVNAALKLQEHRSRMHSHTTSLPNQPNGSSSFPNGQNGQSHPDRGNIETQDQDVMKNSIHESPVGYSSDNEEEREPSVALGNDNEVQRDPTGSDSQVDIWAIPSSPFPPRESRVEVHIPLRKSQPDQSPQVNPVQDTENFLSISEEDHSDIFEPVQLSSEADSEHVASEDTENDSTSEHKDRLSIDSDSLPDMDLSAEATFAQDVANFRAQYPEGYKGSEIFVPPAEDDDITTHINPSSLRMALNLIGHNAWSGMKRGWHSKPFNVGSSRVEAVQALLKLLGRLERLYLAAPRSPRIAEQNMFLSEHSDLLSYYFSRITLLIRGVRRELLANISNQSQADSDTEMRNTARDELLSLGIPMLFHLLASAWSLGGDDWYRTDFTISTVELVMRALSWIGLIYRPMLRALRRQSRGGRANASNPREKEQHAKMVKRQELDVFLEELREVIESSLDGLEEEERERKLERQDREQNLRRQEEVKARWRREQEAVMKSTRERQWRSLMSIRGIHTPVSESPMPPSRGSSAAQELSQAHSLPQQGVNSWSREEKTYLIREIQESYPDLPDLDEIRWEFNRTIEETETMAEELLGLMLEAVHPEESEAQIDARVQEIMQTYRRTKV